MKHLLRNWFCIFFTLTTIASANERTEVGIQNQQAKNLVHTICQQGLLERFVRPEILALGMQEAEERLTRTIATLIELIDASRDEDSSLDETYFLELDFLCRTCNLSQILSLLSSIKSSQARQSIREEPENHLQNITNEFASPNLQESPDTVTRRPSDRTALLRAICRRLARLESTIITDFNEVFNQLNIIENNQIVCCSVTTSLLEQILTQTINVTATVDLTGVFTSILELQNSQTTCCALTTSLLEQLLTQTINVTATVDLTGVFTSLTDIENTLTTCCFNTSTQLSEINALIITDFDATWTILADLRNSQTACCALTTSLLNQLLTATLNVSVDLTGVFTSLTDIENTLTTCCFNTSTQLSEINALIVTDFDATWTILADLRDSQTTCCALTTSLLNQLLTTTINVNFSADLLGVYTSLTDIKNTLTTCCFNTSTQLSEINTLIVTDFAATWTILADLRDTLTTCCESTTTQISDIQANFCSPTFIRQENFDPAGTTPVVLSTAGVYKLAENITYNGSAGTTAITMDTSNISLDLQCFTLEQGNGAADVTGVAVESGLTDIYVKNGTIKNFTSAGISIDDNVDRFKILGTTLLSCGRRGIEVAGTTTFSMSEFLIDECDVLLCSTAGDAGIAIVQGIDGRVTNCRINQCGSTGTNFTGLLMSNCLKMLCNNIDALDNVASTTYIGFDLATVSQSQIRDCRTRNITLTPAGSTARGFRLSAESNSNEIYDCTVSNLAAAAAVDGFLITGSSTNNLITDCYVVSCTSTGADTSAIVHGYNIQSSPRNTILDSIAENNTAPSSTAAPLPAAGAFGFEINDSADSVINRCIATAQATGASSSSIGFAINSGTRCIARENQTSAQTIGFRLDPAPGPTTNIVSKNVSVKNGTNFSQFIAGSTQDAANISAINGSLTNPWTNVSIN